jgi:hypothetical protein
MLLISIMLPLFITPVAAVAGTYEKTKIFQADYGILNQNLYVVEPRSLYDYYGNW